MTSVKLLITIKKEIITRGQRLAISLRTQVSSYICVTDRAHWHNKASSVVTVKKS